MERKIKTTRSIVGVIFTMFSLTLFVLALIGALTNGSLPLMDFTIFALIFFVPAILLQSNQWHEKKKLARLKEEGIAYNADEIDYWEIQSFLLRVQWHKTVSVRFIFTDDNGVTYTTKRRRYSVNLNWRPLRLMPLRYVATIYVNPHNAQDFAVDFHMRAGDE